MKLAKALFAFAVLAMALSASANPEKIPYDTGSAGDRVECPVDGYTYSSMALGDTFDDIDALWAYGPISTVPGGAFNEVVLEVNIDQTWIGDLTIQLYYDEDGNGTYDAGPVSALCRPALDDCPLDGCCGCSGDMSGYYTFGDGGADPMGEVDCPASIPNGCYQPAIESSPATFAAAFNGLSSGGDFWLLINDGAGGDPTTLHSWGVYYSAGSDVLTVKPDGTGDVPTIQDAVDQINPGGTIYLTDGAYSGPGNWDIEFYGKPLELRSQSMNPEACYLDGLSPPISSARNFSGDFRGGFPGFEGDRESNMNRDYDDWGLIFAWGEGPSTIVRGIGFVNFCTESWYGSAVYIDDSSPTIEDCVFAENCSAVGGAMAVINLNGPSSPVIRRCRFQHNVSEWGGAVAILATGANPLFEDCVFHENLGFAGGAVYTEYDPGPDFRFCLFTANQALGGAGIAIFDEGDVDIRYCTFSENYAEFGSAIYSEGGYRSWYNCMVYAYEGSAIAIDGPAVPDFACTNIFGNSEGNWSDNIAPLLGVDGNFSEDPQFCGSVGSWDYRLQSDSPCAAENNVCAQDIGAFGSECGSSASAITTWGEVKTLY